MDVDGNADNDSSSDFDEDHDGKDDDDDESEYQQREELYAKRIFGLSYSGTTQRLSSGVSVVLCEF